MKTQTGAATRQGNTNRHDPVLGSVAWSAVAHHTEKTTLGNGYLGSRIDEERSEMRYVVRIAESREPSRI